MKKSILLIAAAMALSACRGEGGPQAAPSSGATPAPVTTIAQEGGISSGGGGTLPADPASVWQIERYIQAAKRDLRLYFRNEKYYAQKDHVEKPLDQKLFLGKFSVLEALEQTDLELLMDKPCVDGNGQEVDGSIHASRPNTICISAFRIAPKVPKQLARNEVLALIGHELSHLVGANEEEAIEFQKGILFSFDYFKVDETSSEKFVESASDAASQVSGDLDNLVKDFSKLTNEDLAAKMGKLQAGLSDFYIKTSDNPFRFYLKPQQDYLNIQANRLMIGAWYAYSLVPNKQGEYWGQELAKLYGQDLELTPEEFSRRKFPGIEPETSDWPQETIKRIQSREELLQLLIHMKDYLSDQSEHVWKYRFNYPLTKLVVGPWNQNQTNPWEKWMGEYSIVERNCTTEGYDPDFMNDRVGFLIHHPDSAPSHLVLREMWKNGWSESGLEDNGNVVDAGATVSVSGDATSATRVAESGQTWSGRWNKRVETLAATADGYQWKIRIDDKDEYSKKRSFVDCTLKLERKSSN